MEKFIIEGYVTNISKEFLIIDDEFKLHINGNPFLLQDYIKCRVNGFGNIIGIPFIKPHLESAEEYLLYCFKGSKYQRSELKNHLNKFCIYNFKYTVLEFTQILINSNIQNIKSLTSFFDKWNYLVFWRLFEILDIKKNDIKYHLDDNFINYNLFDEITKDPITFYAIDNTKVKEIANSYKIKYNNIDYFCGNILRYIWQEYVQNKNSCVSKYNIKTKYMSNLNDKDIEKLFLILTKRFKIVEHESYLYIKKFFDMDYYTANTIKQFNDITYDIEFPNIDILDDIQNNAIATALKNKITLITGAAGSGKTFLIKNLVNNLTNKKIYLTSFTGKAVARIREMLPEHNSISTIHQAYLKYYKKLRIADILIIDEISMISNSLFYKLLTNLKDDCIIICIGDDNQLMPIEAGSIMKNLLKMDNVKHVNLEKIYRSDDHIIKLCTAIRDRNIDFDLDGIELLQTDKHNTNIFELMYNRINSITGTNQIICPYNADRHAINQYFQSKLKTDVFKDSKDRKWKIGDLCILTSNIYNKDEDYFNGSIGYLTKINKYRSSIKVDFGDFELDFEDYGYGIQKLELGYAITIHMSQGSEWDNVFIFLNSNRPNTSFLTKELIYTACSRAKKHLIIVDDYKKLYYSVNNKERERIDKLYEL